MILAAGEMFTLQHDDPLEKETVVLHMKRDMTQEEMKQLYQLVVEGLPKQMRRQVTRREIRKAFHSLLVGRNIAYVKPLQSLSL